MIHSIRKSRYYLEDEKVAVVVTCQKYDKLREGHTVDVKYQDLDEVLVDRETVLEKLARLSFTEEEIVVLDDPNYHEINI